MMRSLVAALLLGLATAGSAGPWPGDSLYQLPLPLTAQDGAAATLDRYAGHPVLVTLFYSRCDYACPVLLRSLQRIERGLAAADRSRLRLLLVSLDDEHETAASLAALAQRHGLDLSRWSLALTDAGSVRQLAAALDIPYRKLADGGYSHASTVVLLDREGRIIARSSRPQDPEPEFGAALAALLRVAP